MSRHRSAERRTALITGGSGGIGRALAEEFAAHDWDLVLVAREAGALAAAATAIRARHAVRCDTIAADLSGGSRGAAIVAELEARGVVIDALVNNAGIGQYGQFVDTSPDLILATIDLNVAALTHLTRLLLPPMIARRRGWIMQVASIAAFQPGPRMAVYYATKAFVLSLGQALREETRGTGVSVTVLSPGPTPTGFQRRAGFGDRAPRIPGTLDVACVARAGYAGLLAGRRVVIPGAINTLMVGVSRLLPRAVTARIVGAIQRRREPVAPV